MKESLEIRVASIKTFGNCDSSSIVKGHHNSKSYVTRPFFKATKVEIVVNGTIVTLKIYIGTLLLWKTKELVSIVARTIQ